MLRAVWSRQKRRSDFARCAGARYHWAGFGFDRAGRFAPKSHSHIFGVLRSSSSSSGSAPFICQARMSVKTAKPAFYEFARLTAVVAALAMTSSSVLAQNYDDDGGDPAMRIERLEGQLRRLTGQNEELQHRNRMLEQQLQQLQGASGGQAGGASAGAPAPHLRNRSTRRAPVTHSHHSANPPMVKRRIRRRSSANPRPSKSRCRLPAGLAVAMHSIRAALPTRRARRRCWAPPDRPDRERRSERPVVVEPGSRSISPTSAARRRPTMGEV